MQRSGLSSQRWTSTSCEGFRGSQQAAGEQPGMAAVQPAAGPLQLGSRQLAHGAVRFGSSSARLQPKLSGLSAIYFHAAAAGVRPVVEQLRHAAMLESFNANSMLASSAYIWPDMFRQQ